MEIVPFILFSALTAYWWVKHQCFDVCVYMSALYAIVTFCSLVIVKLDILGDAGILFDEYDIELGFFPTLFFCILITSGLLPFSLIYRNDIKEIAKPSSLVLEMFCWFLFVVFFINLYLIADSTAEILSGDLSTVRMDHYSGIESPADVKAQSLPYIFSLILYFRVTTILGLPLFFYYNAAGIKSWWFKGLLLASSLTMPLYGLQMADRTEFTFYGLMFIFCLIFFWKFLTRRFKRLLIAIGSPLVTVVLIYLVAVSQARFAKDGDDAKAYESALQYAGQSYLNFCFFWEKGKFEHITAEREFPFTYHTLFGIDSNPDRRNDREGQHGFFISVFPTYAGDIMLDLSPVGAILWFLTFFVLSLTIIRYSHREVYDASDIVVIFTLAAIPIFGIFYYRYYSISHSYMFLSVAVICFFSKKDIIFK